MMAKIGKFTQALHVTSLVPTGFKICSWRENDFWEKSPVDEYVYSRSRTIPKINMFLHFKMAAKNGGKAIL